MALVERGADVIAQHQDTPSSIQGAVEKGAWAIGSESDMTKFAPQKYLTGTVWNWCPFYTKAVDMVKKGTFAAGEFYGGLTDGTVSLAPMNSAIPAEGKACDRQEAATPLKRFGILCATDGVTFDVPHGRIVALLGENGAGKTTTMNILAAFIAWMPGLVAIDGVDLELGSPRLGCRRRRHGPSRPLVETLTGLENISLAVDHGRFWRRTVPNETVRALLTNLGFKLNLAAQVWQLALAQRQQLEILRTLAAGARVLLLDEPTSVLSPLESNALFAIMRNIASSGRSVIVSSHKLAEVLAVADDVVVMRQGRIVHRGPVQDVDTSACQTRR